MCSLDPATRRNLLERRAIGSSWGGTILCREDLATQNTFGFSAVLGWTITEPRWQGGGFSSREHLLLPPGPRGKACTRCGLLVTQFGWARLGSTETDPRLVVSVPRLVVRSLGLIPVTPGGWPPLSKPDQPPFLLPVEPSWWWCSVVASILCSEAALELSLTRNPHLVSLWIVARPQCGLGTHYWSGISLWFHQWNFAKMKFITKKNQERIVAYWYISWTVVFVSCLLLFSLTGPPRTIIYKNGSIWYVKLE